MQRFSNIVLVTRGGPGQEAAFERALFLARNSNGILAVAGVTEAAEKGRGEALAELVAPFGCAGLRVSTVTLRGTPHVEIIQQVLRSRHDLVVMTPEDRSGRRGSVLGNTARQLLRKCPCAVWLVRRERVPCERVLAGVNAATEDPVRIALNHKILRLARSLADLEGSELHVAHAWMLYGENLLRYRARLPQHALRATLRKRRAEHAHRLADLTAGPAVHHLQKIHLVKGAPEDVIPELAVRERIDVVVMGSSGRCGIAEWLAGSTVERVLERADCSVLIIKPDDFVTPVRPAESDLWRQACA